MNKVFRSALTGVVSVAMFSAFTVSPANAAPNTITDATATSSATIGTSGLNATPITVTAKLTTVGTAETFMVSLPQYWSFASGADGQCTNRATYTMSDTLTCQSTTWGLTLTSAADFSTSVSISVTFPANSLNLGSGRYFEVSFRSNTPSREVIELGNATLSVAADTSTQTPAGGGTTTGGTATGGTATGLPAQRLVKAIPTKAKAGKAITIAAVTNAKVATKVKVKGKGCKVAAVKDKKNKKKIASYKVTMGKKGGTCTVTVTAPATTAVAALNSVTAIKVS